MISLILDPDPDLSTEDLEYFFRGIENTCPDNSGMFITDNTGRTFEDVHFEGVMWDKPPDSPAYPFILFSQWDDNMENWNTDYELWLSVNWPAVSIIEFRAT